MLPILIGHSYFLRFDRKQLERAKPYPPLATLQVAASLRGRGHRVSMFDAMLAEGPAEFEQQVRRERPRVALLYEDNFNYLSKMCLARMRAAACEMAGVAKRAGCFVIVAGSDASDVPSVYLKSGADVVLVGEGLVTLDAILSRLDTAALADVEISPRIVDALTSGLENLHVLTRFSTSDASAERSSRVAPVHVPVPVPTDGRTVLPAWDLVDMQRYRAVWMNARSYFSLNMAASRGCSFRCNWCAKPIWGNRYLQRPAADVAAEMNHLKRTYAPDHIWFADDIFGFRVDWVTEFAQAVRKSDGFVPFTIQTRADLVSDRMAEALHDAGCAEAWIGAESGSQRILDAMNKGTTVQEILIARERLRAHGIRVGFFIQLGYLGEQLPDILATRRLIEEARPDDVGVSVSYPLPGTRFYEQVKEQLGVKTRWSESDDLAMMFQGTYRSEFYREVRDLLHRQVEAGDAADEELPDRWHALLLQESNYRATDANTVLPR